jgi:hypothetical protein
MNLWTIGVWAKAAEVRLTHQSGMSGPDSFV